MIYRNWSLLSSTVVIWGGVATAGLAGIFVFGGKLAAMHFGVRLAGVWFVQFLFLGINICRVEIILEKFNDYLCREGERLRKQDRATMGRS